MKIPWASLLKPVLFIFIGLSATAAAQHHDYLPLSQAETAHRFPLRYLGTLHHEQMLAHIPIGPKGAITQHINEDDLFITGQDKAGLTWEVHIQDKGYGMAFKVYTADLDKNGYSDGVLVTPTGGNGLAPITHIITLMFDSSGRPITFEAEGYFEDDQKSLDDLVDMDGDGRAELIFMNFDGGYWITNIYQAQQARWSPVKGRYGKRIYPLYTRFTHRPNRKPVTPRPGRHPVAPDLSDNQPRLRGRLLSYQWKDASQSEDLVFKLKTRQDAEISCQPDSWFGSFAVLIDDNKGRRIASIAANEQAFKNLLDEIIKHGYAVDLYGQRGAGQCSPELMWARPRATGSNH
jgi:hypothetical protein